MNNYINIINQNYTEELNFNLEFNDSNINNDYELIDCKEEIIYNDNNNEKTLPHTLIMNYNDYIDSISKSFRDKSDIYNQFGIDYNRSNVYIDNINYNNPKNVYEHLQNNNISEEDILKILQLSNQTICISF